MNSKVTALTLLVLMIGALPLLAACPDALGQFSSPGDFANGRISQAWCTGAGANEVGNMVNGMSWDSSTLAGEWKLWDLELESTTLITDTVDGNGTGIKVWHAVYINGQFWLADSGPWGGGGDLTGPVTTSTADVTISYYLNNLVGATVNMSGSGSINDCVGDCIIEYAFGNANLEWMTGSPDPMPSDYPAFLCGVDMGELYSNCSGTISLNCVVATEQDHWGAIKTMYR